MSNVGTHVALSRAKFPKQFLPAVNYGNDFFQIATPEVVAPSPVVEGFQFLGGGKGGGEMGGAEAPAAPRSRPAASAPKAETPDSEPPLPEDDDVPF